MNLAHANDRTGDDETTPRPRGRFLSWIRLGLPFFVLIAGLYLAYDVGLRVHESARKETERDGRLLAETISGEISRRLFIAVHLTEGLASLIVIEGDIAADDRFHALAEEMLARSDIVRNVAIARGTTVRQVHPIAGNERAVGLEYRSLPTQWPAVERAIESSTLVVAGPVSLVQGGTGVIARRPIHLADPTAPGGRRFWGLVSTVVDFPRLIGESVPVSVAGAWKMALRGPDGTGAEGAAFWGETEIFTSPRPIVRDVPLPTGTWQLAMVPRDGWAPFRPHASPVFLIGACASVFLAGAAALSLRAQQRRLDDMAAHLRTRDALARSEDRFRSTLLSIGDAVLTTDSAGRVDLLNPIAEALTGWSADEARGRSIDDVFRIINEFTRLPAENPVKKVLREGIIVGLANHTLLVARDGRELPIADAAAPIRDARGKPSGAVVVFRDQTAERRAEAALREGEERLRLVLENAPEAIVLMDVETGRFSFVNSAAEALFGLPRNQLLQLGPIDVSPEIQPDGQRSADKARAHIASALVGTVPVFEWIHRDAKGLEHPCEIRLLRMQLGGRTVVRGSIVEISDRKKAEARIRRLTRTYACLSGINQAIVREKSQDPLLGEACRIAVEEGGFELAWIGLARADGGLGIVAHAGADDETIALVRSFVEGQRPNCVFTYQAFTAGTRAPCLDIADNRLAAPWRAPALARGYRAMVSLPIAAGGRTYGTFNLYSSEPGMFDEEELALLDELALNLGFALDIQDRDRARVQAEADLRASEERFREIAETIEDVFWVYVPAERKVLYVSPAFERIWGRSCGSLLESQTVWEDSLHPDDRGRILEAVAAFADARAHDVEYRILKPDGRVRWIRDRGYPVLTDDGRSHRIVGVARDVTARRHLAEQLRQAQKMEAIGRLAGGVAHDFNNILTSLVLHVEVARETLDIPSGLRECMDEIRVEIDRAANLTRQLLLFGRRQVMQPRDLDLNDSVGSILRMLRRLIGEHIRLETKLHAAPLMVHADPGMLDQVLMNLAVNARDAMPRGGLITIETSARDVSAGESGLPHDLRPGSYAVLGVVDSGSGISPEHLPHVFEPFFTTKEPGQGTGLGLATVFGIVQQHGGGITLESAPGRGSIFRVYIPIVSGDGDAMQPRLDSVARGSSETVLYVEDEESVRKITARVLRQNGYEVLEAANGPAALETWSKHRARIRVLFTDIVMPDGLSGIELAKRIRTDAPGLPVVFASGYSADIAGREIDLGAGEHFIPKPFSPEQLLRTLRDCVSS
ncbi:PAS domain S-box protein [Congregicoccus parvus]|uniref:PAS domain S-box protein n=1 Tax=Congregicoccus parvus TaxID=3081749 RepID=UPI003FA524C5